MEAILNFDFAILDFLRENITNPVMDFIMKIITGSGEAGIIWIVAAILCLIFKKTRKAGTCMAIALILVLLISNLTLKPLIARPRPFILREEIELIISAPSGFSFPSGHTASSFAAAIGLFIYHKKLGIAALIWATLVAFSRLYMYVHYPTDILAGIVMGIICAVIGMLLVNKFYQPIADKIGGKFNKKRENN
jgi:undecaprenyl-diphosphatase